MFEKMTTLNENVAVLFGNIFTHDISLPPYNVTRLGDFWKFLATNFLTKVTKIFGNFLGYCEKH